MPKAPAKNFKLKTENLNLEKNFEKLNQFLQKDPKTLTKDEKLIYELCLDIRENIQLITNVSKGLMEEREKINEEWNEIKEEREDIADEWDDIKDEREDIADEWEMIEEDQNQINEERDEIYDERDEIDDDRNEIFDEWNNLEERESKLQNYIVQFKAILNEKKAMNENEANNSDEFDSTFEDLHKKLYEVEDDFNNAIEFIQKNREILSEKGIEIPNRINKKFKLLELREKRSYYRIGVIGGSDKTNKEFNFRLKNWGGGFGIHSNQLELLGNYKLQQDEKFAKSISDKLEFNDLNFVIFLQSDHETKLVELEKKYPNQVTIIGRRYDGESIVQKFSNARFLHYLKSALDRYENNND